MTPRHPLQVVLLCLGIYGALICESMGDAPELALHPIGFVSNNEVIVAAGTNRGRLRILKMRFADGSYDVVYEQDGVDNVPVLSADGTQIAVIRNESKNATTLLAVDTRHWESVEVAQEKGVIAQPVFSWSGGKIAYVVQESRKKSVIKEKDIGSGHSRVLTAATGMYSTPFYMDTEDHIGYAKFSEYGRSSFFAARSWHALDLVEMSSTTNSVIDSIRGPGHKEWPKSFFGGRWLIFYAGEHYAGYVFTDSADPPYKFTLHYRSIDTDALWPCPQDKSVLVARDKEGLDGDWQIQVVAVRPDTGVETPLFVVEDILGSFTTTVTSMCATQDCMRIVCGALVRQPGEIPQPAIATFNRETGDSRSVSLRGYLTSDILRGR